MRTDFRKHAENALGHAYALDRELSRGGLSRVFVAEEIALGRRVVIKVLSPERADNVDVDRFVREIHLAARLQHAHIVPILSAGEAESMLYYTMPYVEGETLRERIERAHGAVNVAEAVRLLRETADALAYAHAHGVIHRDIKPENILVSAGHVAITDFGIAKAITAATANAHETLTATGMGIGTPGYIAPEQALGDMAIDFRADLYSFGCVAYELLTGHRPFEGRSSHGLIAAHVSELPPPLANYVSLPPELAALVMQCLEKDPAQRPESAAAVAATLDDVANSQRSTAPRTRRPRTKHWRMIIAVLSATALIAAALVVVIGRGTRKPRRGSSGVPGSTPAIAVLPFQSLSSDTANEYFSDGMTEELVATLARMRVLRVASRASTFAYKGKPIDPQRAGAALHVEAILTGSVRRAGDRVRVAAQLVNTSDGRPLWTEEYDRTLSDVFTIQDDIARAIAAKLRVALVGRDTVAGLHSTNPEANDWYLRGLHVRGSPGGDLQRTAGKSDDPREIERAMDYFERATTLDSTFALAYAALAETILALGDYLDPRVALPRAREAAVRAVSLDPALTDAGIALADIRLSFDWDWPGAEREYQRVLALDPLSATALASYENFLIASRRYVEARAIADQLNTIERSQATDTSALTATAERRLGWVEGVAGHVDESERHFRASIARDPQSWVTHWQYGLILAAFRRNRDGVRELELVRRQVGNKFPYRGHLGAAYALAGIPDTARRIIRELETQASRGYVPEDEIAVLYVALGDTTVGLQRLARAIDQHHYWLPFDNGGNPFYIGLRRNPEFVRLMHRMHAPGDSSAAIGATR